jgi:hypothetical protein
MSNVIYPKPKKRARNDLSIKKVPVPKGDEHPHPPNGAGIMPVHEFTMGLIAPKGSGKTTTLVNLLEIYAGYFNAIYIFSPTIKSDSKWDYVKQLKLLVDNKPLKDWCRKMEQRDESNASVQPAPVGIQFGSILEKEFKPEIPEENFFDQYSDSAFKKIMDENKRMVDMLKDHGKLKTLANRILVIFDDQVGSSLFSGKNQAYFKGVNTRQRQHSASFIIVSQGYKEIPKTIRTNWTCLLLYRIGNMKELEVIYEEFEMGLSWEEWYKLYRQATAEKYQFLFIDMYCDEKFAMRKGFDKALNYIERRDNDLEETPPDKKTKV